MLGRGHDWQQKFKKKRQQIKMKKFKPLQLPIDWFLWMPSDFDSNSQINNKIWWPLRLNLVLIKSMLDSNMPIEKSNEILLVLQLAINLWQTLSDPVSIFSTKMSFQFYLHYMRLVDIWSHSPNRPMNFESDPNEIIPQHATIGHCSFSDLRNKFGKLFVLIKYE